MPGINYDVIFRHVDYLLGATNADPLTPSTRFSDLGFNDNSLNIWIQGTLSPYFGIPLPFFKASDRVDKLIKAIMKAMEKKATENIAALEAAGAKKP